MPLASGLAPSETAEVVSRLDAKGIGYQLNFSGTSVLVAKNDWNQARLVVDDIATFSASPEWEDGMLSDPDVTREKLVHRREEALARTIRRMSGISQATVHIAVVERSPFQHAQLTTTASVVLELRANASFTREQTAAIVALVAGSVEGLAPDGVSVMDTRGRILSSPTTFADSNVSSHFEFRRQLETDLAAKANTMLSQLLGEGRSMVRVSADLDFTQQERTETTYDPQLKVRTQEDIRTFEKTGTQVQPGGVAGTSSNIGGGRGAAPGVPSKETEETNTTYYENAKTVDTIKEAPGKIKRLTVAVMADLSSLTAAAQPAAAGTPQPPSAEATTLTQENVGAIVKQAVGFDAARGDEIEVLITEFAKVNDEVDGLVVFDRWEQYNQLARNLSLGLASIIALLLGFMTLRKMQPVTIPVDAETDEDDAEQLIINLSERIQSNPETMQAIVSSFLNEADDEPDQKFPRVA